MISKGTRDWLLRLSGQFAVDHPVTISEPRKMAQSLSALIKEIDQVSSERTCPCGTLRSADDPVVIADHHSGACYLGHRAQLSRIDRARLCRTCGIVYCPKLPEPPKGSPPNADPSPGT
jgi:hypothetical protein